MKLKASIPVLVGMAALAGAALRGWNLMNGYEAGTHLPVRGDPAETGLIALSAVMALLDNPFLLENCRRLYEAFMSTPIKRKETSISRTLLKRVVLFVHSLCFFI